MGYYGILDGTVQPIVGHFDTNTKFIPDKDVITLLDLENATYKFDITELTKYNTPLSNYGSIQNINNADNVLMGDNLHMFLDLTHDTAYEGSISLRLHYWFGDDNTHSYANYVRGWSNYYNGLTSSDSLADLSLRSSATNSYKAMYGSQPIVNEGYITFICVYDNVSNKHYLTYPTASNNDGVVQDFYTMDSIYNVNWLINYTYGRPSLVESWMNNGWLSLYGFFESTNYVDYKEYKDETDPDDGNGSNPSNPQDEDNRGGGGSHDNSSDTLNSNDYNLDGGNAPLASTSWFAIYHMTQQQMKSFMTYLVGASWQSAVQSLGLGSVFGGIQKVATMPFDVSSIVGNNRNIVICGINTNCTTQGDLFSHRVEINCGNINISRYFGDFKDYNPYTKVYVYLPYIGVNEINTNQVMGKDLNLTYGVDVLDGSCVARLSSDGIQFASYSGNVSTEYPIAGRSGGNVLQTATNLLGQTLGSELGTLAGLTGSLITGASSTSTFQTVGGVAGNWGNVGVLTPFVYIERPVQSIPNAYDSSFGWTCNKYLPLNVLSGYTEVDESIHLSTTATDEEKEMLKEILTSGFYINDNE